MNPIIRLATLPQRIALRGIRNAFDLVGGVPAPLVPYVNDLLTRGSARRRPGETFVFLTPGWIEAVRGVREEYRGRISKPPQIRMNLVVTDPPFDEDPVLARADSSNGELEIWLGHLDDPEITVTVPYGVAKQLLVDMDVQGAMQAFMRGQVNVEGDVAKLLALQTTQFDAAALQAASRVRALTS